MICFLCVGLISLSCVLFLLFFANSVCCGFFPLCCANLIVLQLVSIMLHKFYCVAAFFRCVAQIVLCYGSSPLCCSLYPLC